MNSYKTSASNPRGLVSPGQLSYLPLIFLLLLTAACSTSTPASENTPFEEFPPAVTAESASPVEPTSTPIPVPPLVLFYAEENQIPPDFLTSLTENLNAEGYDLQRISSSEIETLSVSPVYILASANTANQIQDFFPGTPILILDSTRPSQTSLYAFNLSDQFFQKTAFLAGYTASILTPDYRTGFVDLVGSEIPGLYESFSNGMTYFCGLCSPLYPPFNNYPTYVQLSDASSTEKASAVRDALIADSVTAVYLHPGIQSPILIETLTTAGITPYTNESLLSDSANYALLALAPDRSETVQQLVVSIVNNSPPEPAEPRPAIIDRSGILSEGRFEHLQEIIQLLDNESIIPFE